MRLRRRGRPTGVRLLAREGCHLCEEARLGLEAILREFPGTGLEVVDIESDDALHRRHMERIPVVEIGGREICVTFFEEEAVREALAAGKVR